MMNQGLFVCNGLGPVFGVSARVGLCFFKAAISLKEMSPDGNLTP